LWEPGANIEDGSSLIIHWSSGSQTKSTNWANQYDIYFGGAPYWWGPVAMAPWTRKTGPENKVVSVLIIPFQDNYLLVFSGQCKHYDTQYARKAEFDTVLVVVVVVVVVAVVKMP